MSIWAWDSNKSKIWIKTSLDHVLLIDMFRYYDIALTWMPMRQLDLCGVWWWSPPASCWPQMDPMLAPWTLLSGGHSSMLLWLQSTPNTYLFSLMVNMHIDHGSPDKYMILQNHSSSLRFGSDLFAAISSSDCTMCIFKRQGVASFIYHLSQGQFNYGEMMTCAPWMVRRHHLWQSHPQIYFS